MIAGPRLVCCNLVKKPDHLRQLALDLGLQGVDWTIGPEDLPLTAAWEQQLRTTIYKLHPLEVRFHVTFPGLDLGDADANLARRYLQLLQQICRVAAAVRVQFLTIHIGLGRESTAGLEWDLTLARLTELVNFASRHYVRLCLENLAWGWTSRPDLYEKLLRKTGAWGTFDLGHAQVCHAVASTQFQVADFVLPQPERIVNAHIYHVEDERGHQPPATIEDLAPRLALLKLLPLCNWWVLELHEEAALCQTCNMVKAFLEAETQPGGGSLNTGLQYF